MDSSAVRSDVADGIDRTERSLRRALVEADSDEARYRIRTALQTLVVVREAADSRAGRHAGSGR